MAEVLYTLVCEKAVESKEDNLLSIFSVIEDLNVEVPDGAKGEAAADKPIILPAKFTVVHIAVRSDLNVPEKLPGKFKLKDPKGENLIELDMVIDLEKTPRARIFIKLEGFPVTTNGSYNFEIFYGEGDRAERVSMMPLQVTMK